MVGVWFNTALRFRNEGLFSGQGPAALAALLELLKRALRLADKDLTAVSCQQLLDVNPCA